MPFAPMTGLDLPDDGTRLWRYMDLWKFEKTLTTSGLFFVRADRFKDKWDSVLPPKWLAKMERKMCDRAGGGFYTKAQWYEEREIPTNLVSCWNCEPTENTTMWWEYTSSP